jgi:hypothetical protein
MPALIPDRLVKTGLAIHVTAEDNWLAHGEIPVTVVLFAACGAPEAAELPQRCGPQTGAEAIRAHAERLGAVALVITAPAETIDVRPGPGVYVRMPSADLPVAGEGPGGGRCILTVAYRPERDLVKALSTGVRTQADGTRTLAPMLESDPDGPPRVAGLRGLLPCPGRAGGGEPR